MTKYLKSILLLVLLVSSSISINGIDRSDENLLDENCETLKLKRSNPRREIPGRTIINCFYRKGHLRLILPSHINTLHVTLGDDDAPVWQTFVTVENPECDIPELYGEYEITCRTDGNQIFKGKLQFAN